MKRKAGIKLFRSQSDRVLAMTPAPGGSDGLGGASDEGRRAKSGEELSQELEAMGLEKTRVSYVHVCGGLVMLKWIQASG